MVETKTAEECKQKCIQIQKGGADGSDGKGEEEEEEAKVVTDIHLETDDIKHAVAIAQAYTKHHLQIMGLQNLQNIGTLYLQQLLLKVECLSCHQSLVAKLKLLSLKQ